MVKKKYPSMQPPQTQDHQPGVESQMDPQPVSDRPEYVGSGKLLNKVALITGGDSGIGKAVSIAFAKESADLAIVYLEETDDAKTTRELVEAEGRRCMLIKADIGREKSCFQIVEKVTREFGRLDILVNNAAEQHPQERIEDITAEQLEKTFRTNVFAMFYLTKAAIPHLKEGSTIINTASITAYRGSEGLIDYSATKGAIVSFTRSLSGAVIGKGIRVNGVAPGPIWTPLIPATFTPEKVAKFGHDTPMKRAGQPEELAGAFVYLACDDSSYVTGQFIHVNGGIVING